MKLALLAALLSTTAFAQTNRLPGGWLDVASPSQVGGWACDPDNPNTPAKVIATFGGPENSNTVKATWNFAADRPNEAAVNSACGGGNNHRYNYSPTMAEFYVLPVGPTAVYLYAVDVTTGEHAMLAGSPKTVTFKPALVTPVSPRNVKPPVKYFIDSVDMAWDGSGQLYVAVQTNDSSHQPGAALYRMGTDSVLREILQTGAAGYGKCKIKTRNNGTGALVGADANGLVTVWDIPGWVP